VTKPFIPAWFDDLPLNVYQRAILIRIIRRENCFESLPSIASALGISAKTVQRSVKELSEMGLIEVEARHGQSSTMRANWVAMQAIEDAHCAPQPRTHSPYTQDSQSMVEGNPGLTVLGPWTHSPYTQDSQSMVEGNPGLTVLGPWTHSPGTLDSQSTEGNTIKVIPLREDIVLPSVAPALMDGVDSGDMPDGKPKRAAFVKPTPEELMEHVKARGGTGTHARAIWNHYESNGWMVGKVKMKDWKAAANGWLIRAGIDKPSVSANARADRPKSILDVVEEFTNAR
jgi:biotin operon repressor